MDMTVKSSAEAGQLAEEEAKLSERLNAPVLRYAAPPHGRMTLKLFSPSPAISSGTRRYTLDGIAVFDGKAISATKNTSTIAPLINEAETLERIAKKWLSSSRNPNALYLVDTSTDEGIVAPDPLGGAIVYYYSFEHRHYVSTDVKSLNHVLQRDNIFTSKSFIFQIERLLIGNSGSSDSSYEEIRTLDSFEYIHLKNGQLSIVNLREELLDYGPSSYFELMRLARRDILENVVAAATVPSSVAVAHITGGFDSRLVLAAALHAGVSNEFEFFCSGPDMTRDRIIADGLTRKYGLSRTQSPGLASGPARSITERSLGPLFHSDGILTTGPNGRENPSDVVAVGGGYGEMYRTVYAERFAEIQSTDATAVMRAMLPWTTQASTFISPKAWDDLNGSLLSKWQQISEYYTKPDFRGDALWIHRRARVHFGQGSMAWSRVGARIDPEYSLHGYKLAMATPLHSRKTNILGFDLMQSFDASLAEYEFDTPRFENDSFASLRRFTGPISLPERSELQFTESSAPDFNDARVVPERLDQFVLDDRVPSSSERAKYVDQANKLGVNFWQAASFGDAQRVLDKMLESGLPSSTTEGLNMEYVRSLTGKQNETRARIRDIYSVIALISWQIA
ncbi:hypothetical protein FQ154_14140 [Paeniglutamicibacter gangotriensis]|uniref:Asparagine synthetase domain-containing protein n=1 Tax=Paeniglutamicibacter gangotriensis TaxID=254787 RepID=A0A5B0E8K2_9MICC|nr:hypothetical protein [Paeniglutamicibacter gangotriensis]KAA0975334.1 hypothetical protein FQ154_14140 [Paeniglutamicibacter gangotriensis]